MCAQLTPGWARWAGRADWPWSVRVSEDVMIVDPERGVLTRLSPEDVSELGPLLATSATRAFDGSVIRLTTAAHESVAAAIADLALLRSALADALEERHGVDALAAGLHPWSESAGPAVAHGH